MVVQGVEGDGFLRPACLRLECMRALWSYGGFIMAVSMSEIPHIAGRAFFFSFRSC